MEQALYVTFWTVALTGIVSKMGRTLWDES